MAWLSRIALVLLFVNLSWAQISLRGTVSFKGTSISLLNTSSNNNSGYTLLADIDDITTLGSPGWTHCWIGSCGGGSPGGTGTPTSVTQTFGDTVQSKDGFSMAIAMVAPSSGGGTNELEVYKLGPNNDVTHIKTDLWFFCDTNCGLYVLQLEFDDALFCNASACKFANTSTNGTNYMFGSQCDLTRSGGVFEVWNQAANAWVTATYSGGNIPCTAGGFAAPNVWHHLQKTVHLVAGDGLSCISGGKGYPTDTYDNITLDGVSYTPTNTQLCAGPLNAGWNSTLLTQVQMNIGPSGSSGNAATVYYDLENLYYSTNSASGNYFGFHVNHYGSWPVQAPYDTFRTLNATGLSSGLSWNVMQTSCTPTYDFGLMDAVAAKAATAGTTIHFTLSNVPTCVEGASCYKADGTPTSCPGTCSGGGTNCYPPADLNADGSGTDASFKAFITALATHVHNAHVANPSTYADITYYDGGNEYYNFNQWAGSRAQLARMLQDEDCIVTGRGGGCAASPINANAKILTAAMCDGGASYGVCAGAPFTWDADYLATVPNITSGQSPAQIADIMNFHCYVDGGTTPEDVINLVNGNKAEVAGNVNSAGKPMYCSEGGWKSSSLNWNTAYNWLPRYLVSMFATGISKFILFGYDFYNGASTSGPVSNTLINPTYIAGGCTVPASPGYFCTSYQPWVQVYNWLDGATISSPCSVSGTTWSCSFTRSIPSGYQAEAIWDTSQTCSSPTSCTTVNITVPSIYTHYKDLTGATHTIVSHIVPVSLPPVLLQN